MQLFVRNLEGQTLCFQLADQATAGELKQAIEAREGVPAVEQRLVYAGRSLSDEETLKAEATVQCMLSLLGGGKKRKKKVYTTPKKKKHVRVSIKLRALKYYKVAGNGKLTRLRRECPHPDCGAGIFMSQHKDREYCGKCHLTYLKDQA